MDASTAFLFGELNEEIYMNPTEVLQVKYKKYGAKTEQSTLWFKINVFQNQHLIIAVFVDYVATFGKEESKNLEEFERNINQRFKTKDLELLRNIYHC